MYQNECVRIDFHSIKFHALGEKIHGILNPYISRTSGNIEKLPDAAVHEIMSAKDIPNIPHSLHYGENLG